MAPATSYWPPTTSPGLQLGRERERAAALRAEALGAARLAVARAAHGRPARRAGAPVLGHHRVLEHRLGGVDRRHRRDRGQAGAEPGAAQPGRGRADAAGDLGAAGRGARRAERRRGELVGGARARSTATGPRRPATWRRDAVATVRPLPPASRRPPGRPADVAVAVDDRCRCSRAGCRRPARAPMVEGRSGHGVAAPTTGRRATRRRRSSRRGSSRCNPAGCRPCVMGLLRRARAAAARWRGRPGRRRAGRRPRTRSAGSRSRTSRGAALQLGEVGRRPAERA